MVRTVNNRNGDYRVEINHHRYFLFEDSFGRFPQLSFPEPSTRGGLTICHVYFTPTRSIIDVVFDRVLEPRGPFVGNARCSFDDVFREKIGVDLALARAIREIHPLNRWKREEFWAAWEAAERNGEAV